MIVLVCVFVLPMVMCVHISNKIPQPTQSRKNFPTIHRSYLTNQTLVEDFDHVNYQLQSHVYTQTGTVPDSQLYNISAYQDRTLDGCTLYGTDVGVWLIQNVQVSNRIITYTIIQQEKKQEEVINTVYLITDNKKLHELNLVDVDLDDDAMDEFEFLDYEVDAVGVHDLPYDMFPVGSEELTAEHVKLTPWNGELFIVTPYHVYLHQGQGKCSLLDGYVAQDKQLVKGTGFYSLNNSDYLWVAYTDTISIYTIDNHVLSLSQTIQDVGMEPFTAVTFHNSQFFILQLHSVYIASLQVRHPNQFTLEGDCTRIQTYNQVMHLSCTYSGVSYIGEYLIQYKNSIPVLSLNRFYTNHNVEGIRSSHRIGLDKMFLVGDDQAVLQGYAVNRELLKGKWQPQEVYYFQNGVDVLSFDKVATLTTSVILSVHENSVRFIVLEQGPPELFCKESGQNDPGIYSFLVVFRTTFCPKQQTKSSELLSTCQQFYPMQIQLKQIQYSTKVTNLTLFSIILVLVVVTLIIIGVIVKKYRHSGYIERKIQNAINKLKSKQSVQLEKI